MAGTVSSVALSLLFETGDRRRRSGESAPSRRPGFAARSGHAPTAPAPAGPASAARQAAASGAPDRPSPLSAAAGSTTSAPPASSSPLSPETATAGLSSLDPLSLAASGGSAGSTGPGGGQGAVTSCGCALCRLSFREPKAPAPQPAPATSLASGSVLASGVDLAATFRLHSLPSATKTLYLDFDGHITSGTKWNSTYNRTEILTPKFDFDGNVDVFSTAELQRIQAIWNRVAEDFAPFGVNVTTEDPGAAALSKGDVKGDRTWGARAAIGGSSYDWFGDAAGGVSFIDVFGDETASPCFIFEDQLSNGDEKFTAEAISHELGHTLGLQHDGTASSAYYSGQGSGSTGWAPIMGTSYYQNLSQWSRGEYSGANNTQDDLAILSGSMNGFGYRIDDHGNSSGGATVLPGTTFNSFGIIETRSDSDWFSFSISSAFSDVSLSISSACQAWLKNSDGSFTSQLLSGLSSNLDISASLYRADGTLVASSNPADSLTASFDLILSSGTYLLSIDGSGFGDPRSSGYSDYGSLGQYVLSGSLVSMAGLVISGPTSLSLSEAGGQASFSVSLSQAPGADVVVSLSSSDPGESVLGVSSLLFTPANWATPQSVVVSGRDDLLVDGTQSSTIRLSASSSDATFNGSSSSVAALTSDNDVALASSSAASLGGLQNRVSYVAGTPLVGNYVDASASSDNTYLTISEALIKAGKSRTSALDGYQWRFDNLVNASQLVFEGFRSSNSENDNFRFSISTNNGSTWISVLTVSNSSEATLTANLTTPINGTALVLVSDTDRRSGNTVADTLHVDRLALVSQLTDLRNDLSVVSSSPQAIEDSGAGAAFTIQRGGDSSRDLDVAFSLAGSATLPGSSGSDYSVVDGNGKPLDGSVRLAAGQSSATVRILPAASGNKEADETVLLTLLPPDDTLKLGTASDRIVIVESTGGAPAPFLASSSTLITGRTASSGSAAEVAGADGLSTTLTEVLSGSTASATSQLAEQRWSFPGLSAASSFVVKARASSGDDSFRFEYSDNGGSSWTSLTTLGAGFQGISSTAITTPLSGDLLVRVLDTNRNAGAGLIDSLSIDAMAFLATGTPLPF